MTKNIIPYLIALLIASTTTFADQFERDCEALTAAEHRLTGSQNYDKALDYLKKRLEDIGVDQIFVQNFHTTKLVTKRCEMVTADDRKIKLFPMRPNGIVPPATPKEGITGKLVWAGRGRLEDYEGRLPEHSIIVLDYNSREAWLQAFRLGAEAVIFTKEGLLDSSTFHYTTASANLPRYYFSGSHDKLPIGTEVTLHAEINWEGAIGKNLLGYVKGTEPVLDAKRGPETFIYAASLDSFGEVPELSPGARAAANCAGLLNMAEELVKKRPRRNSLIAFFDAKWGGHLGASALYRLLDYKEKKNIYEKTGESLEREKEYLNKVLALANQEDPLADEKAKVRHNFILDLKDLAKDHVVNINAELIDLRWERRLIELEIKELKIAGKISEAKAAESKITPIEVEIDKLNTKKEPYNTLLRALTKNTILDDREYVKKNEEAYRDWQRQAEDPELYVKEYLDGGGSGAVKRVTKMFEKMKELRAKIEIAEKKVSNLQRDTLSTRDEDKRKKLIAELGEARENLKQLNEELDHVITRDYRKLKEKIDDYALKLRMLKQYRKIVQEEIQVKGARLTELEEEEAFFEVDKEIYQLFENQWIGMHISMLFGDQTGRWGLVIGGDSQFRSSEDKPGLYNRVQSGFLDAVGNLEKNGNALEQFETKTVDLSLTPPEVVWAAPSLAHSGDIAGRVGFYNFAFGTIHETLRFEGTPDDRIENLNLDRIQAQMGEAAILAHQAGESPRLSLDRQVKWNASYLRAEFDSRLKGAQVMAAKGSSIPNTPTPGAVIQLFYLVRPSRSFSRQKTYGMYSFQVLRSNLNGTYTYGPALSNDRERLSGFGILFDDRGIAKMASAFSTMRDISKRVDIREIRPGVVVLPPQQIVEPGRPDETKVMDGMSNGEIDRKKAFSYTQDGVVYWYAEDKNRAVKVFYEDTISLLNSGPPKLQPKKMKADAAEANMNEGDRKRAKRDQIYGTGIDIQDYEIPASSRQSAADMWRLNDARLTTLRDRGVKDSSIYELHGRAEDLLLEAQAADNVEETEAKSAASFHLQRKVYDQVRQMFDDLVLAVLILLGLCVPFAFALERLLIGSTSVYRQIVWFIAFFLLTFILLYYTHPAFAISNAPLIIFLGFAILVLSTMVIWIIMRKFEVELKVLQGMESTVHAADISRVSTIAAAMNMGISSMRRRPLRTALSAVTIILLTFTILCFASFGTQTGVIRIFNSPAPDYTGVFVRDYNWSELTESFKQVIDGRWGESTTMCSRYWICPGEEQNKAGGLLITRGDGTEPLVLRGVLGLQYAELERREEFAELLDADEATFDQMAWITQSTAEFLKVKAGDKVIMKGKTLTVGRLLNDVKLTVIRDMDDSSILPVDFEEEKSTSKESESDPTQIEQKTWKTIPVDACAIVSANTAKDLHARLRAIVLYTEDPKMAASVAEEIARFMPVPIAATLPDGVYLHVLGATLSASGVKDLFFPILLGGLVIFGTMLGSVADREKEVYTFSALGLAPPHVAGLFFAEAMVYSVIGGLSGYLLAQALMKVLDYLASHGLVQVPEMNYSSTNAIVTILIVMATVLISALYPAYKASKSANPGVMRNWKIPQPQGNVLDLVFPFTVSQYDITGVVSFLREHFDTYSDTGLGTFMARDTRLVENDDGQLQLECRLALAPFDLGVTQSFLMKSVPSEIEGIDEVAISLTRLSGQPKDWFRLNKVLLDDLRKQFLIWRSLPSETMELYRERTLIDLGKKAKAPDDEGAGQDDDKAQGTEE